MKRWEWLLDARMQLVILTFALIVGWNVPGRQRLVARAQTASMMALVRAEVALSGPQAPRFAKLP